ncbi:hypothetical protein [Algibacter mikhailovii]|uniref:hypothetical protein n=1 Tax=Algibacter mikhailovii TaxID=425498 RepID=UPI0024948B4C|nr:hypothetical protein [Algibacter mikhailovii]
MKKVMITLAGGMFVLLLTSFGIKKNIERIENNYHGNEYLEVLDDDYVLELTSIESMDGPEANRILRVNQIEVYEVEEDVNLGFDTKKYLPENFDPVEGLEYEKQLEYEESIVFKEVFGEIEYDGVLNIQDIELYEVEM